MNEENKETSDKTQAKEETTTSASDSISKNTDTKVEDTKEETKRIITFKRNNTYVNKLIQYITDKGFVATEDESIVDLTNPFTYSSFNIDGYLIGKKSYKIYARDYYVNGEYQWTQCFII